MVFDGNGVWVVRLVGFFQLVNSVIIVGPIKVGCLVRIKGFLVNILDAFPLEVAVHIEDNWIEYVAFVILVVDDVYPDLVRTSDEIARVDGY